MRLALAPKLSGSLNAALGLRQQPLQQCLLFSSVAALLGNAGQTNYSAANAVLDTAAQLWQQHGTPTVSLQWGPWAGGGMATPAIIAKLAVKGFGLVQPASGLQLLDCLLGHRSSLPVWTAPVVALDWRRMLRPAQQLSLFFAKLLPAEQGDHISQQHMTTSRGSAAACSLTMQQVLEQLLQLVAAVAGTAIEPNAAFMSAGLDSLGESVSWHVF